MPTNTIARIAVFTQNAFAGLGILYALQLAGALNLTIQSLEISPAQAREIQDSADYATTPKRR